MAMVSPWCVACQTAARPCGLACALAKAERQTLLFAADAEDARVKAWQGKAEQYFAVARACDARAQLASNDAVQLRAMLSTSYAQLDLPHPEAVCDDGQVQSEGPCTPRDKKPVEVKAAAEGQPAA